MKRFRLRDATRSERQLAGLWAAAAISVVLLRPVWIAIAPHLRPCTFRKLTGTYGQDIENDSIWTGEPIQVAVTASVETGSIEVYLKGPDDQTASVQIAPGETKSLTGIAEGRSEYFEVHFRALDGEAANVSYQISYEIQ